MKNHVFVAGTIAGVLALAFGAVASAEDKDKEKEKDSKLESVEKEIVEKMNKLKSYSAKSLTVIDMDQEGMTHKGKSEGSLEYMRKGDKMLFRMEGKSENTMKMGDQETKMDSVHTSVCDGDYVYSVQEQGGQKQATKMKMDPSVMSLLIDQSFFDRLAEDHNLKLLPEEKVDGHDSYVIEAAPKTEEAGTGKMVMHFDKGSGMQLKSVQYDDKGKPAVTTTISDFKPNVDINPERFVFKAPPDVEVMDLSKMYEDMQGQDGK